MKTANYVAIHARRLCFAGLCAVTICGCTTSRTVIDNLSMQSEVDRWQLQEQIAKGGIAEVTTSGGEFVGRASRVGDTIVLLHEREAINQSDTLSLSDIQTVRFIRHSSKKGAKSGAWLGAGFGFTLGLFSALGASNQCSSELCNLEGAINASAILPLAGLNAALFAGVGALFGRREVVALEFTPQVKLIAQPQTVGVAWSFGRGRR